MLPAPCPLPFAPCKFRSIDPGSLIAEYVVEHILSVYLFHYLRSVIAHGKNEGNSLLAICNWQLANCDTKMIRFSKNIMVVGAGCEIQFSFVICQPPAANCQPPIIKMESSINKRSTIKIKQTCQTEGNLFRNRQLVLPV